MKYLYENKAMSLIGARACENVWMHSAVLESPPGRVSSQEWETAWQWIDSTSDLNWKGRLEIKGFREKCWTKQIESKLHTCLIDRQSSSSEVELLCPMHFTEYYSVLNPTWFNFQQECIGTVSTSIAPALAEVYWSNGRQVTLITKHLERLALPLNVRVP